MATLGQCKACQHGVSDEARTCPKCGQPNPCLLPPAVGTVHRCVVNHDGEDYAWVTLPSGFVANVPHPDPHNHIGHLKVGDAVTAKVLSIDRGYARLSLVP